MAYTPPPHLNSQGARIYTCVWRQSAYEQKNFFHRNLGLIKLHLGTVAEAADGL